MSDTIKVAWTDAAEKPLAEYIAKASRCFFSNSKICKTENLSKMCECRTKARAALNAAVSDMVGAEKAEVQSGLLQKFVILPLEPKP